MPNMFGGLSFSSENNFFFSIFRHLILHTLFAETFFIILVYWIQKRPCGLRTSLPTPLQNTLLILHAASNPKIVKLLKPFFIIGIGCARPHPALGYEKVKA
jgi:hypothetical protein